MSYHRVDGVLHSCPLNVAVPSVEVVIDCFEPADIVVRVSHKMDSKHVGDNWFFGEFPVCL